MPGLTTYRASLSNPLLLEDVLVKYPNLRISVMHYGAPFVDEMIAILGSHPQVYIDIGGIQWYYPREFFYSHLKKFIDAGLIDVNMVDPTIQVDLVNSSAKKNFFHQNFYSGLDKAYMQKKVAIKISKAQKNLQKKHPGFSLLIMDAARPLSVSQKMYDKVKGTKFEKFVANPKSGSMHNWGIAVDLTIVDEKSKMLDMGVIPFYKSKLVLYWSYGKYKLFGLSDESLQNQKLLANIMKEAGFYPLPFEWWHFNGTKKNHARKTWKQIL